MLFDGGERLAHPGSELAGNLAQSIKDILSPGRVCLLLVQDIAGIASLRLQTQNILASKASDRTRENRGAPGSLTDFPRDFRSQPRILRLAHESQRFLDLLVPNQTEERRLLKLHGQSLAEGVVEDWVARLVIKIRED